MINIQSKIKLKISINFLNYSQIKNLYYLERIRRNQFRKVQQFQNLRNKTQNRITISKVFYKKIMKQNKDPKRLFNNKFHSFQNLNDNKFSAYKYQKNLLISSKNHYGYNNTDDHDYVHLQENNSNKNRSFSKSIINDSKTIQKTQSIDNIQNLCDLWEKLGNQGQKDLLQKQNTAQQLKQDNIQLTQQQLLKCFGQQQQENRVQSHIYQNNPNILSESQTNTHNNQLKNQKNIQQKQNKIEYDQDLLQIWGQEENHIQNNTQDISIDKSKQTKQSNKVTFNKAQTGLDKEIDQDQFHLQDPNRINLKQSIIKNQSNFKQKDKQNCDDKINKTQQNHEHSTQITYQFVSVLDIQTLGQQKSIAKAKKQQISGPNNDQSKKQPQYRIPIIKQILNQNYHKNMTKLIYQKDFKIYNHKQFSLSNYKQRTYSYFGIEVKTKNQSKQAVKSKNKLINQQVQNNQIGINKIFYFYSFQTDERFLELKAEPLEKEYFNFLMVKKTITVANGHKMTKKYMEYNQKICYKIRISSSLEHIATLFMKKVKNGYLFDLRLYDTYQNLHSQPIALIQVKDGYANQCCYCDTNVFLQKKYLKKANQKQSAIQSAIEKLKMILNIKNGKLTANMGINGIQSSPYNCCLQNMNTNRFIFLMGLLQKQSIQRFNNRQMINQSGKILKQNQTKNQNKFIIKIGEGISPLLALAISAARKIYIDSFQQ